MSTDPLSDVLSAVQLSGSVFFDVTAKSPWVAEAPPAAGIVNDITPGAQHVIEYQIRGEKTLCFLVNAYFHEQALGGSSDPGTACERLVGRRRRADLDMRCWAFYRGIIASRGSEPGFVGQAACPARMQTMGLARKLFPKQSIGIGSHTEAWKGRP